MEEGRDDFRGSPGKSISGQKVQLEQREGGLGGDTGEVGKGSAEIIDFFQGRLRERLWLRFYGIWGDSEQR